MLLKEPSKQARHPKSDVLAHIHPRKRPAHTRRMCAAASRHGLLNEPYVALKRAINTSKRGLIRALERGSLRPCVRQCFGVVRAERQSDDAARNAQPLAARWVGFRGWSLGRRVRNAQPLAARWFLNESYISLNEPYVAL